MRLDAVMGGVLEAPPARPGTTISEERRGGGGRSGTQKFMYQKCPDQSFPTVHFVLAHDGHFGLEGASIGQVWTRHLAPAAPASRPSSPSQFHDCACHSDSALQFWRGRGGGGGSRPQLTVTGGRGGGMAAWLLRLTPRPTHISKVFLSRQWRSILGTQPFGGPLPPLRDTPSGRGFFTGPWTVTRSSLRMLRRVAAF